MTKGIQRGKARLHRIATCALAIGMAATALSAQKAIRVETLAQVDGGTGGITIDPAGAIFSSDFGADLNDPKQAGKHIFKITPDGKTSIFASGFVGASGSGMDSEGNFYQSNIIGGTVSKVTPDGKANQLTADGLQLPVGIEVDDADTLYVANCGSGSIQKITKDGVSSRFVESKLLVCPNGITRDDKGNFYVANFSNGDVVKITPDGTPSVFVTLPGGGNGHLIYTHGVLWVIARNAHQVYRVTLDGTHELVAGSGEKGGKDGAPLEASFCFPNDLGWSPDGKTLYINEVADASSKGIKLAPTRIRKITFGS